MMMQPKINLIVLGDAAIGKTSLLRCLDKRGFQKNHLKTIAVDYIQSEYHNEEDDKKVQVKIWDTAGQEKFRNITYQFYRQADGIILGFDITNEASYQSIKNWVQSIYKVKDQDTPVVLFSNKIDLEEKRTVSQDAAVQVAENHHMNLHTTSALTEQGVQELFEDICSQVYKHKIRPQIVNSIDGDQSATTNQSTHGGMAAAGGRMMDRPSFPLTTGNAQLKRAEGQEAEAAGCCSQ